MKYRRRLPPRCRRRYRAWSTGPARRWSWCRLPAGHDGLHQFTPPRT